MTIEKLREFAQIVTGTGAQLRRQNRRSFGGYKFSDSESVTAHLQPRLQEIILRAPPMLHMSKSQSSLPDGRMSLETILNAPSGVSEKEK